MRGKGAPEEGNDGRRGGLVCLDVSRFRGCGRISRRGKGAP